MGGNPFGWYRYQDTNCYAGHGALLDIDMAQEPAGMPPMTREKCLMRCALDTRCDAVAYQRHSSSYPTGTCWKKQLFAGRQPPKDWSVAEIMVSCAKSSSKDTYYRI